MKAFIPIGITDSMLVSSTMPEFDTLEPEYSATTTYVEFDQVSVIEENSHLVYESLQNNNTGHDPALQGAWWILKSSTNRWRMFDYYKGAPSVASSPLTLVLRPGQRIDSIAFGGIKASSLDVTVRNGLDGPLTYTLDAYLLKRNAADFYDHFFSPFVYQETVANFEIPPIPDPVLYITITDPSGTVELSRLGLGQHIDLGKVEQTNPIVDADNYSEVTWDAFGQATLEPIPTVPTTQQKIFFPSYRLNSVRQFRELANARPVFWSGLDDIEHDYQESLQLFGVYRNYQIDLSDPNFPVLNLSLKGI